MKTVPFFVLGWFICCLSLQAQSPVADPLALTLPNGKVLHFQTEEQKQKFEAGMARVKPPAAGGAPVASASPSTLSRPASPVAPSATSAAGPLDFTPSAGAGAGVGNPTAPIFTAVYYMAAPDSWVGKKVTIAIACLQDQDSGAVKDGLRQFNAVTWNNTTAGYLGSDSGGTISVYTKPEMATRLLQLCGSKMQYDYYGRYKTTMVQGVFAKVANPGKRDKGGGRYCVYVEK